jgi:alpha-tubulin suppressor-like RCC1 family protein
LWAWGKNGSGRLGLGDTTNRSSPVQIGALTTWLRVSASKTHSAAIKTDGTMWSWGQNTYGQLGLGNTAYYSSPKQVGALTAWLDVSAGTGTHILAISN